MTTSQSNLTFRIEEMPKYAGAGINGSVIPFLPFFQTQFYTPETDFENNSYFPIPPFTTTTIQLISDENEILTNGIFYDFPDPSLSDFIYIRERGYYQITLAVTIWDNEDSAHWTFKIVKNNVQLEVGQIESFDAQGGQDHYKRQTHSVTVVVKCEGTEDGIDDEIQIVCQNEDPTNNTRLYSNSSLTILKLSDLEKQGK